MVKDKKAKIEREPLEEIDLPDDMHSALVDLLIEKSIITEEEMKSGLSNESR